MSNKVGENIPAKAHAALIANLDDTTGKLSAYCLTLSADERGRLLHPRRGAERMMQRVHELAVKHKAEARDFPLQGMADDLALARQLQPIEDRLRAMLTMAEDTANQANAEAWEAFLAHYAVLSSMATRLVKHLQTNRGWPAMGLASLMVLAVGCSPSAVQLADRGQLVEACQAAAPQEVSAVVDRVVAGSDLKVRIAASSRTDTCKAAEIAAPNKADKPWMVVSIDVEPGTLGTALQEVTFESPWIRAAGWTSRYAAIGDSYTLLTGKQLPARGTSASIQDLVVWSGEALLGNQESRAKIAANFASVDMPEDVVAAQRLTTLLAPSCSAHAHAGCRTAALVVPGEAATGKAAAIGMSVKYAVQGRDTESRCTLWEHVVVPLSPGSDLNQQVSAAIPPQEGSWMVVRSKAMRFGAMAEDPFFEFDQSSH